MQLKLFALSGTETVQVGDATFVVSQSAAAIFPDESIVYFKAAAVLVVEPWILMKNIAGKVPPNSIEVGFRVGCFGTAIPKVDFPVLGLVSFQPETPPSEIRNSMLTETFLIVTVDLNAQETVTPSSVTL